jgi:hypothetical protein
MAPDWVESVAGRFTGAAMAGSNSDAEESNFESAG